MSQDRQQVIKGELRLSPPERPVERYFEETGMTVPKEGRLLSAQVMGLSPRRTWVAAYESSETIDDASRRLLLELQRLGFNPIFPTSEQSRIEFQGGGRAGAVSLHQIEGGPLEVTLVMAEFLPHNP